MLKDKNIVLGISGGIAAYKACEIISRLKKAGANVDVIMTKNATEFITPLTISTLAKSRAIVDTFDIPDAYSPEHISLAKKAELFLIAPATANIIGKVANGIADDMLSTTIMACTAKVVFAPAMNDNMYNNKIVQNNIQKLKDYGYEFIEPAVGELACGTNGVGRLEEPKRIVEIIDQMLEEQGNV